MQNKFTVTISAPNDYQLAQLNLAFNSLMENWKGRQPKKEDIFIEWEKEVN